MRNEDLSVLSPLIMALDTTELGEARRLAGEVREFVDIVKVGLQLFSREGTGAVKALKDDGFEVFLDIKMNDIPNTVATACEGLCEYEPFMLTVHTTGGQEMMRAAGSSVREACARSGLRRPLLIGVTVLTSMDFLALEKIGVNVPVEEQVIRLARLAVDSGMDGLVTSPLETLPVRRAVGDGIVLVTPGVRLAPIGTDDQKRVATPREAIGSGADFLVVGRPLYTAADPGAAAAEIIEEISTIG
ncbi:MAG: orotidine-5'-phosphate decarboxylase [Actinomycetia bacterium]|nr:orotidine-5'-phosphate decarboxylase [Actinomycetota bacterium]MBU4301209.1 orotidine-5'-phosphate decarboxylase [Actinomycetota bacterium]MCG2795844.1 orotidine-5'-phosphate decarboxylase [Actinomycetes bacterium]